MVLFGLENSKGHVISLGEDNRFNHGMESKSLSKVGNPFNTQLTTSQGN
jgi:hypothetical protein